MSNATLRFSHNNIKHYQNDNTVKASSYGFFTALPSCTWIDEGSAFQ